MFHSLRPVVSAPRRFCAPSFLRPVVSAPRRFCAPSFLRLLAPILTLFLSLCLGVLLFPRPVQADGYVVTYDGANIFQDKGFDSLDDSNPIKATLTWQGSGPAPGVIVEEDTDASWFVDGSGTGKCSCGLPNPVVFSNDQLGDESATRYTFYPAPASGSIPLPTVTTSGSTDLYFGEENDNFVNLSYTVEAYPVTISLGGTTKDGSGSDNILIGQGCSATLSAGPCSLSGFQWNPGGSVFSQFAVASDQSTGQVIPVADNEWQLSNPYWHYLQDSGGSPFSVTCTATASMNGTAIGAVTGQRNVQVWVPYYFMGANVNPCTIVGDLMQAGGPDIGSTPGINFTGRVGTPALFRGAGAISGSACGLGAFLQLCSLNENLYSSVAPTISNATNGYELDNI